MALHNLQRGYRGQTIPDQLHHRGVASLRPVIFAVALFTLLSSGDDAWAPIMKKMATAIRRLINPKMKSLTKISSNNTI